jgi:hypothetical protein
MQPGMAQGSDDRAGHESRLSAARAAVIPQQCEIGYVYGMSPIFLRPRFAAIGSGSGLRLSLQFDASAPRMCSVRGSGGGASVGAVVEPVGGGTWDAPHGRAPVRVP